MLVDTSAWVDYLRGTPTPTVNRLRTSVKEGGDVATTDVVVMELLGGARDEVEQAAVRDLVGGLHFVGVAGLRDFEEAAALYRACRSGGETVRKMTDCLIAAVVIRVGATLLHADRDFDVLARHTRLQIEPV